MRLWLTESVASRGWMHKAYETEELVVATRVTFCKYFSNFYYRLQPKRLRLFGDL